MESCSQGFPAVSHLAPLHSAQSISEYRELLFQNVRLEEDLDIAHQVDERVNPNGRPPAG